MDVCRIIKADISVKVGEIITTSKFERKYSEGRAIAESLLEDIRKCECPEMLDRKNSLFFFQMMINWNAGSCSHPLHHQRYLSQHHQGDVGERGIR